MRFTDRAQAGRFLASKLLHYKDRGDVLILALPRGGILVACEVASLLNVPWDVLVIRKIGLPGRRELGMGALAAGGVVQIRPKVAAGYGVSREEVDEVLREEQEELRRRELDYRDDLPFPEVRGKTVLLIDDGLATGSSMSAAVEAVRKHGAAGVVVAVPVGATDSCGLFLGLADETVCAYSSEHFEALGQFYKDFHQCTDQEIHSVMEKAQVAKYARLKKG